MENGTIIFQPEGLVYKRIVLTAILLAVSLVTFAQVDTINYRPHNSTKTETTVKTTKTKDGMSRPN